MRKKTRQRIEELERQVRVLMFKQQNGATKTFEATLDRKGIPTPFGVLYNYSIIVQQLSLNEDDEIDVIDFRIPLSETYRDVLHIIQHNDYVIVKRENDPIEIFLIGDGYYTKIHSRFFKTIMEQIS